MSSTTDTPFSERESNSFSSSSTRHLSIHELMHYDMKGESLRPIEIAGDSESDKDLVITTLTESLQIHKEIMERLHSEREAFIDKMERERSEEQEITRKEKEQALQAMEEQLERYERLESAYNLVVSELETKKTEYKKMESRFYDHVRRLVE